MCLVDIYKESDPSVYNTVYPAEIWTGLRTLPLSLMIYVQPCLKANYLSSMVLSLMRRYQRVVITWLCMLVIESGVLCYYSCSNLRFNNEQLFLRSHLVPSCCHFIPWGPFNECWAGLAFFFVFLMCLCIRTWFVLSVIRPVPQSGDRLSLSWHSVHWISRRSQREKDWLRRYTWSKKPSSPSRTCWMKLPPSERELKSTTRPFIVK